MVSLTIVGCFEWEALLQRFIHVQFKQNQIKQKQFTTKGKGGKWKLVDRGEVFNNREEKKKNGSCGAGDNPPHKVYNVYVLFCFVIITGERG